MNELYKAAWDPLHNFFIPSAKILSKKRIGSRLIRKFDFPKTPYLRLMESGNLSQQQKQTLQATFNTLNPIGLQSKVESLLKTILNSSPVT